MKRRAQSLSCEQSMSTSRHRLTTVFASYVVKFTRRLYSVVLSLMIWFSPHASSSATYGHWSSSSTSVSLTLVSTTSNTLTASMSPAATCDLIFSENSSQFFGFPQKRLHVAVNVDSVPLLVTFLGTPCASPGVAVAAAASSRASPTDPP